MDQRKTCPRCRQSKPRGAFSLDRHARDGLVTYCKKCVRERRGSVLPRRKNAFRDEFGKTCLRCGKHKAWAEYRRQASAGDGHQTYCRACANVYERECDERNAEAVKARYAEKLAREVDRKTTKTCRKCGQERPLLEFYAARSTADGRANHCMPCAKAYQREWRAKHPERVKQHNRDKQADPVKRLRKARDARSWRLKLYGLTAESYNALLATQGGVCAVCGRPGREWDEGRSLDIDHDHMTNLVRGLLCNRCNVGLGSFVDDIALLQAAIAYLKSPPARKHLPEAAS